MGELRSGVVRSLHFESSIGIVQTEAAHEAQVAAPCSVTDQVRYHPEHGFDHDQLMFGVHSAFLEVVKDSHATDRTECFLRNSDIQSLQGASSSSCLGLRTCS